MHSTLQPTGMPLARPRSRTGLVACVVLVAAVTFLSLYISAAISLSVALTSLINLIGLAAAIALWTLPRKWLRITAMVVLGAIVALQLWLGFDLLAFRSEERRVGKERRASGWPANRIEKNSMRQL